MGDEFILPPPPSGRCKYADDFHRWGELLVEQASKEGSLTAIKTAKLYLAEQYMTWRNAAPAGHRDRLSKRGHICLYGVFIEIYDRLQQMELSISQPITAPPSQSKSSQMFQALVLGETV
jgi:hypothetical protein